MRSTVLDGRRPHRPSPTHPPFIPEIPRSQRTPFGCVRLPRMGLFNRAARDAFVGYEAYQIGAAHSAKKQSRKAARVALAQQQADLRTQHVLAESELLRAQLRAEDLWDQLTPEEKAAEPRIGLVPYLLERDRMESEDITP
jgi:hypothetical protein